VATGPVVIGYDGSPAAQRAVQQTLALVQPRPVLVVTVWEPGRTFELMTVPTGSLLPTAVVDIRAALELDEKLYENATRTAEQGADLARQAGLEAQALVVADELTVADTLVRVAVERSSPGIAVGWHGHSALGELLLGSTTQRLLRRAPCPVVVVRHEPDQART
jgi:nucleotide-binding universal stress UspA family protein